METTFVALIAYAVFSVAGWVAYAALVANYDSASLSPAQFQTVVEELHSAALSIACGPAIAVLWIAVRMARREFSEYLALNWPSRDDLVRALLIVAVLWLVEVVSGAVFNPTRTSASYEVAVVPGGLFLVLFSLSITGPIMEEFLFRGFMYRGWSQSFLGPALSIVLISAIWAAMHVQSSWWTRLWIFGSGLALGYFRLQSGSTWLAVVVHSAINIFVVYTRAGWV